MFHVFHLHCLLIFCLSLYLKYFLVVVTKRIIRVITRPSNVFLASLAYKNYYCSVRENEYSWCRLGLKNHFVKFVDRKCHLDLEKKMICQGDNRLWTDVYCLLTSSKQKLNVVGKTLIWGIKLRYYIISASCKNDNWLGPRRESDASRFSTTLQK
jgi:hypothetical protein